MHLRVERTDTSFTGRYEKGQVVRFPIAHKDGSYFADEETLARLDTVHLGNGTIDDLGHVADQTAGAGSAAIAGSMAVSSGTYVWTYALETITIATR